MEKGHTETDRTAQYPSCFANYEVITLCFLLLSNYDSERQSFETWHARTDETNELCLLWIMCHHPNYVRTFIATRRKINFTIYRAREPDQHTEQTLSCHQAFHAASLYAGLVSVAKLCMAFPESDCTFV